MSDKNTTSDILIAGAVAAFTVDLLVYPLDTLKTRLQSPDYARLFTHEHNGAVNRAALFRGLYQGVGSVIIATLPSSGAFFTTYEGVKYTLGNANRQLGMGGRGGPVPEALIHATASGIAEAVSCAILTPAEVIKQNAQMVTTGGGKANATMQTLARFRADPVGLWRGYSALLGRNLPFTALQFPLFERLKESLKAHRDRSGARTNTLLETGLITAASAGTAGSVAAVVTTPVDVVKTRIMLAAAEGSLGSSGGGGGGEGIADKLKRGSTLDAVGRAGSGETSKQRKKQSSWAIGKQIYRDAGVKGLFRGGALRGVWTMLGSGLYLGVYESGRVYLARRRGVEIDEDELF